MRRGRLAAITALALLIAPGQWWRSAPVADTTRAVRFVRLAAETPPEWPEGLTLQQAWHLDAANSAFSGFSALVLDDAGFRTFSDFGQAARFARPTRRTERIRPTALPRSREIMATPDVEAAVFDKASGNLWLSYEYHNAIRRIDAAGQSRFVRPPELAKLGYNSGVEAMARLADGRFVMLAERTGLGAVFAGDPIAESDVTVFHVEWPEEYRPTDMAVLPDGRVLVLLRMISWGFPPVSSRLMIGDPQAIREGQEWELTQLATIDQHAIRENYEGLAVEPAADGALTIWLMSDDNRATLQRSLLLKLRWMPETQTARAANRAGR